MRSVCSTAMEIEVSPLVGLLTYRTPAHVEACGKDIDHGKSCNSSWGWTFIFTWLGAKTDVLGALAKTRRRPAEAVLLTNPRNIMQNIKDADE